MKYILGLLSGVVGMLFVIIIIKGIEFILNLTISEFLTGWFSCIGCISGIKIYETIVEL